MSKLEPRFYQNGLCHEAKAMYASGPRGVHAEGVIVGYFDVPSYIIVTPEGRTVPWRCDLTDVGLELSEAEYHVATNSRRLRDGRDPHNLAPEPGPLPIVRTGMSVLEVYERVIAAGYNPAKVAVEYSGCGSHEIELALDVRSPEELAEEVQAEEKARAERARQQAEYEARAAEAEATDADPTKGWE